MEKIAPNEEKNRRQVRARPRKNRGTEKPKSDLFQSADIWEYTQSTQNSILSRLVKFGAISQNIFHFHDPKIFGSIFAFFHIFGRCDFFALGVLYMFTVLGHVELSLGSESDPLFGPQPAPTFQGVVTLFLLRFLFSSRGHPVALVDPDSGWHPS